jgi:hypothetical protein
VQRLYLTKLLLLHKYQLLFGLYQQRVGIQWCLHDHLPNRIYKQRHLLRHHPGPNPHCLRTQQFLPSAFHNSRSCPNNRLPHESTSIPSDLSLRSNLLSNFRVGVGRPLVLPLPLLYLVHERTSSGVHWTWGNGVPIRDEYNSVARTVYLSLL